MEKKLKFKVEIKQVIATINKDEHPWFWSIVIESGHIFCTSSKSFKSFNECLDDFSLKIQDKIELLYG